VQSQTETQITTETGELPARGTDAVEILKNDHVVIKSLLERLVADTGDRKTTLEQLKSVLTIHNATEENIVYPALAVVGRKKAESLSLYHETAEADTVVFELAALLKESDDDVQFNKRAKKLQKAVLEHIDKEENTAFPHLEAKADAAQAKQLTHDVREFRSTIHMAKA
jgi:hemerythrin superfamily protein